MNQNSTWANRENLSKATIEAVLKEIDDVERLGEFEAQDNVPYPLTAVDVSDAVRFILKHDLVGLFAQHSDVARKKGVGEIKAEYDIPLESRTEHGRSTPHTVFRLLTVSTDGPYFGTLYHYYQGKHDIVHFGGIPKTTISR